MDVGGAEEAALDEASAAGCEQQNEVVIWGTRNFHELLDAVEAKRSPCSTYFVGIPPVRDEAGRKTVPRVGPLLDRIHDMRSRGIKIHAMAEFHTNSWEQWVAETGGTWYQAGQEFRFRMDLAGYDTSAGDTWVVDELHTPVRRDEGGARLHAQNAVRGLYDGSFPNVKGTVLAIGVGIDTTYFGEYKPVLEDWLCDAEFWQSMDAYVRFFGQETYADPHNVCVAGPDVPTRALRLNEFTQHLARLAAAGPECARTAGQFLDHAYVPMQSAAWMQDTGYGDTNILAENMRKFVRLGVFSARSWSKDHYVPDHRIGFAWAPWEFADPNGVATIADALAGAVARAYAPAGIPLDACGATGSWDGCDCEVTNASLNPAWENFPVW